MVRRYAVPMQVGDARCDAPLQPARPALNPLELTFHRQAVRRLILTDGIPLCGLTPGEVLDIDLMHPLVSGSSLPVTYVIRNGKLEISSNTILATSSRWIGGINPYALYSVSIDSITTSLTRPATSEIILELSTADSTTSVQLVARHPAKHNSLLLQLSKLHHPTTTHTLHPTSLPAPPYTLHAQLSGHTLTCFATLPTNTTIYLGHTSSFAHHLDLRPITTHTAAQFRLTTHLAPSTTLTLSSITSHLSPGIGQADPRPLTLSNGHPYRSPHTNPNHLFFTSTARGTQTGTATQALLSLDTTTSGLSSLKFLGTLVLDFGDGVLRNGYAGHLFYTPPAPPLRSATNKDHHPYDKRGVWRGLFCDFGGTPQHGDQRSGTGLILAETTADVTAGGFIVLHARTLDPTASGIKGMHEDPYLIFDSTAKKWRLLTTCLTANMGLCLFEADEWDGPYTLLAGPGRRDSTGGIIQMVDGKRWVFCGSADAEQGLDVYSYPDLRLMGGLDVRLPPFRVGKDGSGRGVGRQGRVWPNVVPLDDGDGTGEGSGEGNREDGRGSGRRSRRYMALMMDRTNFPGVEEPNWSYGALYLYRAVAELRRSGSE